MTQGSRTMLLLTVYLLPNYHLAGNGSSRLGVVGTAADCSLVTTFVVSNKLSSGKLSSLSFVFVEDILNGCIGLWAEIEGVKDLLSICALAISAANKNDAPKIN